ncbi:MAG: response regulator [candidate division Zixibacteria bacterium]|nr:response regulator [candidate division Zixibacteria bacterium]
MNPIKVMLVDDEEDLSLVMAERLEMRGFDAHGVTNSEKALELLKGKDFDVIVIDVKMPGIGGIDLMRQIKKEKPGTEVILFTGHGSRKEGELGISEGAFDFLIKPVTIESLIQKIEKAAAK